MTEHFTLEEAVALAKNWGKISTGYRLDNGQPYDHLEVTVDRFKHALESVVTAKLAEWEVQGAVAWQGRSLDMSEDSEGWSNWQHIDTCDLGFWRDRVAKQPNYYEVRPLYPHPLPAQPEKSAETTAPNAWFDGYNAAVKDAINKGVYEDGKHVGFLAKSSADSVGEYYLVQFRAPSESAAQAAPKDELGDLRSALWLSNEALKTCRVEAPGTRFKEKNFSESAVARALAAINALLAAAPQPQKKKEG